jgi:parvulin-like peptidyl-prolyl isomerase
MRFKRKFTALCAFFVLSLSVAACGGGIPGDSVAVVAGNPITTAAVNHWMYVAAKGNSASSVGSPVIVPNDPPNFSACLAQVRRLYPSFAKTPDKTIRADCKALFNSLSSQVMNFLITTYWYQAQAAKLGIKVSQQDVNKALARIRAQEFRTPGSFGAFLTATGETLQDVYYRLRFSQIAAKLAAHYAGKITPARIVAYFHAHPSQFGTPETRNLRIVRTNSQAQAAAALAALKAGQSWNAVAKQYSVDAATKNNGGQLPGIVNGEEEHALNQAAFSAPKSKVIGPIHGTFGWYVLEVTGIKPATKQSLTKATRQLIRQLLTSTDQSTAQATLTKDLKKNWGGQTQCRTEYSMALCTGYKPPTTTPGQTTTAPAG